MPLTLTAFEGMEGPDPLDPDPEPDPEPEPPDPDPDDPEPPDPDPFEPDPEEPDPDPLEPEPEPCEPELEEPEPAAPAFTIPPEQAERQKKERLKSPKRRCERWWFIGSPNRPALTPIVRGGELACI
jgi:hypothetical protein